MQLPLHERETSILKEKSDNVVSEMLVNSPLVPTIRKFPTIQHLVKIQLNTNTHIRKLCM